MNCLFLHNTEKAISFVNNKAYFLAGSICNKLNLLYLNKQSILNW